MLPLHQQRYDSCKAHILRIPKIRLSSQTVENRGQEKAEKANLGIGSFCSLCSNTATNSWLRELFDLMVSSM